MIWSGQVLANKSRKKGSIKGHCGQLDLPHALASKATFPAIRANEGHSKALCHLLLSYPSLMIIAATMTLHNKAKVDPLGSTR